MPSYRERFPVGSEVRIIGREELEAFASAWTYHHRPTYEQLEFAGRYAKVKGRELLPRG